MEVTHAVFFLLEIVSDDGLMPTIGYGASWSSDVDVNQVLT